MARLGLLLNEDAGARADAAKVAIVLTDGPVTRGVNSLADGELRHDAIYFAMTSC